MNLDEALTKLAGEPDAPLDLAEVALLLCGEEYTAVDVEAYLGELTALAHDVRPRLRGRLPARVQALTRYLFHELGFRGNDRDYYDPRNSYFNEVLDRRLGIPLTLSLVAMSVGTRAGLAVHGVGLPGHFIVKAALDGDEVLFDPFHGGRVLEPDECGALVERVTGTAFEVTAESLLPAAPLLIVVRMLTNLKAIYLRTGDFARAARVIGRLAQLLPADPTQRRDLGVCLLRSGQPGRAMEHLTAYVTAVPDADDLDDVRQLQRKAWAEIVRWN
jgi:regulator of sirC expression with transglutaminase-like and TPR domain